MASNHDSSKEIETMFDIIKFKILHSHESQLNLSSKPAVSRSSYTEKTVKSVEDVKNEIQEARKQKRIVRVRGSAHSPADHIIDGDENGVLLTLSGELRKITKLDRSNDDNLYVRVGAGCYLGESPGQEGGNWEDSLCKFVDDEGFAFPVLGGISYQSVGGFMMTGSAGGSLKYGFSDVIEEITFVNGKGEEINCSKTQQEDLFHAVGVSMGLLGVITNVTFCLEKKFFVKGSEKNVEFGHSFLKSSQEFHNSFSTNEYYHLNWLPQKYCNRVIQWTGEQEQEAPANLKPYVNSLGCPKTAFAAAASLWFCNLLLESPGDSHYQIIGWILKNFVKSSDDQEFYDNWFHALPNDDTIPVNGCMKVDFTEIWVPIREHEVVLNKLKCLFNDSDEGQLAAGSFATEIYCAKKSSFWLSMSYNQDMLRIDPYWFHHNCHGDKREFFGNFWNELLDIEGARLHWGKWLPTPGQTFENGVTFNLDFLKGAYDKMQDWLKKREEMDPDQVFVNKYWRGILEIPKNSMTS